MRADTHTLLLYLILTLAWILTPVSALAQDASAGIRLHTADDSIYIGDSVVIEVESVGLLEPVNTQMLSIDADLIRETTGTRIDVVQGRVVDVHVRRMEFLPRSEGLARFGPLRGNTSNGSVQSNSLSVQILPPPDDIWEPEEGDASIAVRVSAINPFVRQEVTVDIELRHRFVVTDEQIVLPDFDGFDVVPVFEARRTIDDSTKEDLTAPAQRLVAWRYLLWPQGSGEIEIGVIRWSGTLIRSRTSRASIDKSSEPVSLAVQPAATDHDWWLPARRVRLRDSWSNDPRELTAGEEIERTLILEAEGVLASQLPDVEPLASRSMSSVSLGNSREQQLIGDSMIATAQYRYRLTARSPVPVFLDTVRVPWWDTENNDKAEAIVPARRVNIGLPDRADLLADIALRQSPWVRFQVSLASIKVPTAMGILILVVLLIALLALLFLPWPLGRRGHRDRTSLPPM